MLASAKRLLRPWGSDQRGAGAEAARGASDNRRREPAAAADAGRHAEADTSERPSMLDFRVPAAVGSPRCEGLAYTDDARLLPDGIEGGQRLRYPDAAIVFLAWLQQRGDTGEIRRDRLWRLYQLHCVECGLAILPGNYFMGAVGRLADKFERGEYGPDGRRTRFTTYNIPLPDAAATAALRRAVA